MKFDEFWNTLTADLAAPKQFATQTKQFFAKYSGGRIIVTTSDDSLWTIDRSTARHIWNKAISMHEKMRFIHTSYAHENIRTSSYIISLMKHFVADESKME
jgi:glucose dehydrogenase